jgi:hypothetical protein
MLSALTVRVSDGHDTNPPPSLPKARIGRVDAVTKWVRPNCYSVNDRVGFVDRNPHRIIATAIAKKAANSRDMKVPLVAIFVFCSLRSH